MAGLLRVTPPCELLVDPKPHWRQTYVVLGDHEAKAAFKAFAYAQVVNGAGMWATHQKRNETYLVITLEKAGCDTSNIRKMKEGLYELPGTGGIEWVRPFTRRLQCLFGWDAAVENACKQHDTKELGARGGPGAAPGNCSGRERTQAADARGLPALDVVGPEEGVTQGV